MTCRIIQSDANTLKRSKVGHQQQIRFSSSPPWPVTKSRCLKFLLTHRKRVDNKRTAAKVMAVILKFVALLVKMVIRTVKADPQQDCAKEANWRLAQFFRVYHFYRFPPAGISATWFRADWRLNWSLTAKWAWLLITQLTAVRLAQLLFP